MAGLDLPYYTESELIGKKKTRVPSGLGKQGDRSGT